MMHRLAYLSGLFLILSIPFDLAFLFAPTLAQLFGPRAICLPSYGRCVSQSYLYYIGLDLILFALFVWVFGSGIHKRSLGMSKLQFLT